MLCLFISALCPGSRMSLENLATVPLKEPCHEAPRWIMLLFIREIREIVPRDGLIPKFGSLAAVLVPRDYLM